MYKARVLIFIVLSASVRSIHGEDNNSELLEDGVCENKGDSCDKLIDVGTNSLDEPKYNVKAFTVASQATDGYQRFNRSAHINGIHVETLGMGIDWHGEDTLNSGGGYKLNLLKRALKRLQVNADTLVLYTDSYNVIFTQPLDDIVKKFRQSGAGVLFGAERHLAADQATFEHLYPNAEVGSKFLNAAMFIGYLPKVQELLSSSIRNTECDHQFMARAYLDEAVRNKLNLQLDHRSTVFQSLDGAIADVTLKTINGESVLLNTAHDTMPAIVHGSGPSNMFLNNYGNYIAGAFVNDQCVHCQEQVITLASDSELPTVTVAVFIAKATPFFSDFLRLVDALDYPKNKLNVFVHNAVQQYTEEIQEFLEAKDFTSTKWTTVVGNNDTIDDAMARNMAVAHAQLKNTDYLFVIDADARLDNPQTLRELLRQNRTFIGPMLSRHKEVWSNFWGALSEGGFYARSHDYIAIVEEDIRGIWNVPYITSCYLAKKTILPAMSYYDAALEPDMALCKNLRKQGIFMYVSNELPFGHLTNDDGYNPLLTNPDFYTMLSNPLDWERRYIHADYAALLRPNVTHKQPCPDVFWFPIVTERFCAELIAVMEAFGQWSDGSSNDERLKGGYEAVPTRDIHMGQVGLDDMWLKFLQIYVRPLQEAVYAGYYHNPPEALMNFVVRYKPTEQPFLKPHHDTSTYTINIALNRAGVDYVGGGCRFVRFNCSVTDTKVGHMLMHPGRLTHYHEGLYVTEGTRYIMVSFVDP